MTPIRHPFTAWTPARRLACAAAAAAALCLLPGLASAQGAASYPERPVTLVVPFPPGGGTDTGARLIAQRLGQKWGKSVIVENKAGAAGAIGADFVAKAKADGYSLLFGNIGTQAINPSLYKNLPYAADTAFAPITLVAELPLVMMVNANVPAKTVDEFVALAKAKPDGMSYSTSGAGSSMHLAAEMFKSGTGTSVLHVPYRGGGPAVGDLLAGHVQLSFATVLESSGHLKSGKVRALAVTGKTRVPALPNVPTLAESAIPDFNSISWIGLLAPAGTPKDLVEKIAADVRQVLAQDEVKARLAELGALPVGNTPDAFAKLIASDRKRYAQIIAEKNIQVD
ncbi:tripartite tricarboxylate transporter substrate binding protein [Curvibacter sp. RS43]|uniref:Bug family tripartite tricarboxylate transporter substrate binding protein n=1 Tax=Curvibacter microcysteis TaxID=3026419 RepID=UPI002361A93F|nr:tripartite tricarboxylate transporter substrate binding protein [Curvibacter sp. RS43]MDD0808718.1 tripartite tricarboxylate transporter substrate binding protein [Curvibacter sp. RS43]